MPAFTARTLLSDPRQLYSSYEALLGAPVRVPASSGDDRHRHQVSGALFGAYAEDIRYGVLSLNGRGLETYGNVFVELRDVVVQERTSFLYENSFTFAQAHDLTREWPSGYSSVWDNRHELAAVKLQPKLTPGSGAADWARELLLTGNSRGDDEFIEAHIYGAFNSDSVEGVGFVGEGSSRAERLDMECIRELMAERSTKGARR